MGNLYNTLLLLCNKQGITLAKMCRDCGISKSLPTDLKAERRSGVSTKTAQKIADYFGISVENLLTGDIEKAPTTESRERDALIDEIVTMLKGRSVQEQEAILQFLRASEGHHGAP